MRTKEQDDFKIGDLVSTSPHGYSSDVCEVVQLDPLKVVRHTRDHGQHIVRKGKPLRAGWNTTKMTRKDLLERITFKRGQIAELEKEIEHLYQLGAKHFRTKENPPA